MQTIATISNLHFRQPGVQKLNSTALEKKVLRILILFFSHVRQRYCIHVDITRMEIYMRTRKMQLFGRKNKIEFTADRPPREISENPRDYSYVHNFKVHFKTSRVQMIATKMDISISSEDPETPTNQLVTSQFNQQMMMILNNPNLRTSKDKFPSYHITMIEYKESIAMPTGKSRRAISDSTQGEKFTICSNCENKLPSESSFCNKCGQSVE